MNIVNKEQFGQIEAFQLGYGPVGRPFMSVYIYFIDGVIIDTGQRNMQKYVLDLVRNKHPRKILLTHHHEDHSGNAYELSQYHQLEILGHGLTAEKMAANRKILPYQRYIWGKSNDAFVKPFGETIESDHFIFHPVHTPGHSKDHTVYLEEKNGWLFSGDLFLGERIKFFRSNENIYDQIGTLKKCGLINSTLYFAPTTPACQMATTTWIKNCNFLKTLSAGFNSCWKREYPKQL